MSDSPSTRQRKPADLGLRAMVVFFVTLLLAGVGLMAYPTVADWWNRMHQSRAVASYIEQTEDMGAAERKQLLAAAREYNQRLEASAQSDQMTRWNAAMRPSEADRQAYEHILDVSGTGIMGYVTIPRLKTRLPIYHGTDDAVLQIAVGHLPGSSLPVGGEGTHAVVSGHTGLPSARLLTGLDEMRKGDTFAFHVLGETYTYQVDEINTVLPDDFSHLNVDPSADYATLITCTPYGINTHRLLVRGHRIPNPVAPDDTDYDWASKAIIAVGVALGVLIAGIVALLIWRRVRRNRHGGVAMSFAKHARGAGSAFRDSSTFDSSSPELGGHAS